MTKNSQKSDQVLRKFVESFDVTDWEVATDSGWQPISSVSKTVKYDVWRIVTHTGKSLDCADTHVVFDRDFNEIFVRDCIPGKTVIQTSDGPELVVKVFKRSCNPENMYDLEVDSESHRFYSNKILSHNSVTFLSIFLWYILFHSDFRVAIFANKGAKARKLLGRLKKSFENLPKWLQQGVQEWNKGNIELENGSGVIADSTSATGARSETYNIIFLDEFAHVPINVQDDFFTSTYPTISAGKTTKVVIVSTPHGMEMFYKIWTDANNGKNNYTPFEVKWYQVPGYDEEWKKETIANTSEEQFAQEFECVSGLTTVTIRQDGIIKTIPINQLAEILK